MKKTSMQRWLWRLLALFFLLLSLFFAYQWVQTQPTQSPVKKVQKNIQDSQHKAYSTSARKALGQQLMKDDQQALGIHKQGYVAMPNLSIFMPIYDNAYSKAALDKGANTAQKDSPVPTMGAGNYTLAAHNWDNGYTGFSALQQKLKQNSPYLVDGQLKGSDWLNGKSIYLANDKGIYRYTVKDQTTVDQNQGEILDPNLRIDGQAKLTIITCLYPDTTKRIITNAQYSGFTSWQKASDKEVGYFDLNKQKTNVLP
ncbi:class A sortase [Leuconostocaceae bacterium ESL0958]|nr:class A sortase [Leuconostocaceae bacterium ESL0958]